MLKTGPGQSKDSPGSPKIGTKVDILVPYCSQMELKDHPDLFLGITFDLRISISISIRLHISISISISIRAIRVDINLYIQVLILIARKDSSSFNI